MFREVYTMITFSGKEYGEFLPANMRLGASLMIPIDEYNRVTKYYTMPPPHPYSKLFVIIS